jgi:aconitase A
MTIANSVYILVITVCDVAELCKPCSNDLQAVNDEGGDINKAFDHNQNISGTIPDIAKRFKARRQPWALVVDENYGEGSAREHAALQPRFYGR